MLLEGVYAAVPTPFYPDERVYLRKLEANMAHYSRTLLAGMLILGSIGEAPMVSEEESREILRVAAEASSPEKVLLAGVGRESVRSTVELAELAARFGYDAVLVRPPSYYAGQMGLAVMLHYYRSIADRSPLPVVLYNVPMYVPCEIPVEIVAELAMHPNIAGIKDSSGNVDRIAALAAATRHAPRRTVPVTPVFEAVTARMRTPRGEAGLVVIGDRAHGTVAPGAAAHAAAPSAAAVPAEPAKTRSKEVGFQLLCGSGSTMLASLEAGASGAILGFAAFAPQASQEIYFAWKDRNPALAREKQERIVGANRRIVGAFGVPGVKYACDFNGYYGGRARAPLLALSTEEKSEVASLLAGIRN